MLLASISAAPKASASPRASASARAAQRLIARSEGSRGECRGILRAEAGPVAGERRAVAPAYRPPVRGGSIDPLRPVLDEPPVDLAVLGERHDPDVPAELATFAVEPPVAAIAVRVAGE